MLKACKCEVYDSELHEYVCSYYKGDLSKDQLETQLPLLQHLCRNAPSEITISDMLFTPLLAVNQRKGWQFQQHGDRVIIIIIIIIMPVTNASSKRSFSALRTENQNLLTHHYGPRTPERSYAATRECRKNG